MSRHYTLNASFAIHSRDSTAKLDDLDHGRCLMKTLFLLWSVLVLIHPKLSLLLSDCFHNGHKLLFETWDRLLWPLLGGLAFRTFLSSMVLQTDSLIYRVVGET